MGTKKSKTWWIDFIMVCSVLLLAESARGVVISTLAPYITSLNGDAFFLSLVVAIFSAGRLISSLIFGWLADYYSTRSILLLSTLGCVVGNAVFCLADSFESKMMVLFSRILTGFGTGILSVARTHVSITTPTEERTKWMSWLGIVQFVGFSITPVVGNIDVSFFIFGRFPITVYTFATLILMLLELVLFACLLMFMSDGVTKTQHNERVREQDVIDTQALSSEQQEEQHSNVAYQAMNDEADQGLAASASSFQVSIQAAEEVQENQVYLDDDVQWVTEETLERDPKGFATDAPPSLLLPAASSLEQPASSSTSAVSIFSPQRSLAAQSHDRAHSDVYVFMESARRRRSVNEVILEPHGFVLQADEVTGEATVLVPSAEAEAALEEAEERLHQRELATSSPFEDETSLDTSKSRLWLSRTLLFLRASYIPIVFVLLNFSGRGVLSVAESYGAQLYNYVETPEDPSPSPAGAANFFFIMGCLGLLTFLSMGVLVKYVEESTLLLIAFIALASGFACIVDTDDYDIDIYDFTAAFTLIYVIGTPISQTLSVSMLSKHFSQQQKQQQSNSASDQKSQSVGFWMGVVTAAGSLGRIFVPLAAGVIATQIDISSALLFTSLFCLITVPLVIFPLRAYAPYLNLLKRMFTCWNRRDDEDLPSDALILLRTSSDDKTELVSAPMTHSFAPSSSSSLVLSPSFAQPIPFSVSARSIPVTQSPSLLPSSILFSSQQSVPLFAGTGEVDRASSVAIPIRRSPRLHAHAPPHHESAHLSV